MKRYILSATALAFLLKPSQAHATRHCTLQNQCSSQLALTCEQDSLFTPNISPYPSSSTQTTTSPVSIASHTVTRPSDPSPTTAINPTSTVTPAAPTPAPTEKVNPRPTTPPPSPTATPTLEPTTAPTTTDTSNSGGLDANRIFELVNQHRQGLELPPLQKDDRLCQIANSRKPQLNNEIFGSGYVHQGFNQKDLDWWVTENMVHQPSEQAALNWWLSSSLHRTAIESSSHTHTCTACSGNTCIQLFTSWQPK